MGSWGVTAHDSDYGLDLRIVVEENYLQSIDFKCFNVKDITELLKKHILDEFNKESKGQEQQYIDFFNNNTFPYYFGYAVMLIAECLTKYLREGKYTTNDYVNDVEKVISEFIFTADDLSVLLKELRNILEPTHSLYEAWTDSEYFKEWQAHIQMLCDTLSKAIRGKNKAVIDNG